MGGKEALRSKSCSDSCKDFGIELIKHQRLYQGISKYALSDSSLENELTIPFLPNYSPEDNPEQAFCNLCFRLQDNNKTERQTRSTLKAEVDTLLIAVLQPSPSEEKREVLSHKDTKLTEKGVPSAGLCSFQVLGGEDNTGPVGTGESMGNRGKSSLSRPFQALVL
ncbi:hypothetical protein TNCV_1310871 [Trichonephila clavipes]|nr:hypothetical protein TNCV_1310871 [Trichonephila clavipes]